MSDEVTPVIDDGIERHIYLATPDPQGPFPAKIYVHAFVNVDSPVIYIPQLLSNAIVVMSDDDNVVGHCYCSNCEKNINFVDKYCRHCGAKLGCK